MSMGLASCHVSGAYSFELVSKFFVNLSTPGAEYKLENPH